MSRVPDPLSREIIAYFPDPRSREMVPGGEKREADFSRKSCFCLGKKLTFLEKNPDFFRGPLEKLKKILICFEVPWKNFVPADPERHFEGCLISRDFPFPGVSRTGAIRAISYCLFPGPNYGTQPYKSGNVSLEISERSQD
jgi:hypothetical protein